MVVTEAITCDRQSVRDDFATLLEAYRNRAGRTRNALALDVGVDASYLTRIAHGDREPPRQHIVEAVARVLRLTLPERNRLLVSAGYAPPSLVLLGTWPDVLQEVLDTLNDPSLSPEDREAFAGIVQMIAVRWRGVGQDEPRHRLNGVVHP